MEYCPGAERGKWESSTCSQKCGLGFFFSRIFFVGKTGKIPNRELWNGLGFKGLKSHPIPIPWAGIIPVKPHSNGAWENSRESGNSFPKSHLNFPFSTWNCVLPSQFPMKTFRISLQRIGNVPAWCQSPGKAGTFRFPSPVIDFLRLENRDNTGIKMGMKMKFFSCYSRNWDGNDPQSARSNPFPWEKGAGISLAPPAGFLWRDL